MLQHATGLLAMARGDFDAALAAFAAAKRMQTLLAVEHALGGERRSRIVQMQAWRGDLAAARATLAEMAGEERDRAGLRIARAALHLAENAPERALDVLKPVVERRERSIKESWAAIDASLLDALARDRLGDRGGVEASIERALELAEPEGVILSFALFPVRELLERHPRHRTSHATLLTEILDVLAGASPRPSAAADEAPGGAQRGRTARRPLPAEQPQGAGDRVRALRLVEHGPHAPPPHLRQARRAQPHGSGGARPRARTAGARPHRALNRRPGAPITQKA